MTTERELDIRERELELEAERIRVEKVKVVQKSKFWNSVKSNKGLASVAVCAAGALSMYISNGETGIGWTILGLIFIWG